MKNITLLLLTILPILGFGQSDYAITNNTFDSDISTWKSIGTGASVEWDATQGNSSLGALKLNAANDTSRAQTDNVQMTIAGSTYELTLYVKGTNGATFHGQVFQSGAGKVGAQLVLNGNWQAYTISDITLATGVNTNVRLWCDDVPGGTFYFDDVYLNLNVPAGNYVLTADTNGNGVVTTSPDDPFYTSGSSVNVQAAANTHWLFDSWSGNLTGATNPTSITMDADKNITANFIIDPSFDYAFTFDSDGDLEGWSLDPQLTVASHTGSLVTLTPTTDQWARFSLFDFPIPANSYNKVTITLKNESTNDDELGLIIDNGSGSEVITMPMTTGDTGFKTYTFNQTQFTTAWSGDITTMRIRFTDADNITVGRSSGTGNIIIDNIVFEYDSSLSAENFNKGTFTLYPNPAKNVVYFNTTNTISKIEVFSITGKKVLETSKFNNNAMNISSLKSGLYLLNIRDSENNTMVKKLIKQ
ncbi:T9SS type A sorting domain-containing protein [Aestuariibaculum suncheonense]|uniref:T9SS type A sorting domain-containing protein n=1 Tax=Aestuariibaculum suncheonense TaxID=1028745 RepID=A0A8J6UBP7_9FLAO|nr:T9SS type A sorting domain-containing protein [Aestuariibaculum suncheonense]MBD0835652.1 T9SS type A sorting domain-containing protein [Aestuariibaculum suncheonense]